jgi:hypothetical protein
MTAIAVNVRMLGRSGKTESTAEKFKATTSAIPLFEPEDLYYDAGMGIFFNIDQVTANQTIASVPVKVTLEMSQTPVDDIKYTLLQRGDI